MQIRSIMNNCKRAKWTNISTKWRKLTNQIKYLVENYSDFHITRYSTSNSYKLSIKASREAFSPVEAVILRNGPTVEFGDTSA